MENKEKTLKQLEAARLKVQQYENKIQLLQNRKKHLEKKADRQRTHHLCCWRREFPAIFCRE